MRTYAKSCVRRKSFYSKNELQMLMLSLIMISGGHICVSKLYTNVSPSLRSKRFLCEFVEKVGTRAKKGMIGEGEGIFFFAPALTFAQ